MSCYFFFPARFLAQYAFMRAACALRLAADILRRFFVTAGARLAAVVGTAARAFFGGRPRLLTGPCSASIALQSVAFCNQHLKYLLNDWHKPPMIALARLRARARWCISVNQD